MLPAILLHDVGWKMFPPERLAHAVGPNARYPELQRQHEIEGARIARAELKRLALRRIDIDRVIAIIDGHDTRKDALSLEDALMKDADKLWRFTATASRRSVAGSAVRRKTPWPCSRILSCRR